MRAIWIAVFTAGLAACSSSPTEQAPASVEDRTTSTTAQKPDTATTAPVAKVDVTGTGIQGLEPLSRMAGQQAFLRKGLTLATNLTGVLRVTGQAAQGAGGLLGSITGAISPELGRNAQNLATGLLDQRAEIKSNVLVTARPQLLTTWRIEPNLSGQVAVADGGTITKTLGSRATVTSSANPSVYGQAVTLKATVKAVAPGTGTPTAARILASISSDISACSRRNSRVLSLPWPIFSPLYAYQAPDFSIKPNWLPRLMISDSREMPTPGEPCMIHVVAVITARPDLRAQVLEAFQANCPAVRAEKGCIEYGAAVDAQQVGLDAIAEIVTGSCE